MNRWRRARQGSAAACVTALLLASGAASAENRRVDRLAVLPIILAADQGQVTISSVFDDIAAAAAGRLGISLISYEEIDSKRGLSDRVMDCGSDENCIADKLRAFDARMGMVVVVNLALNPPLLSLSMIDTDNKRSVGSETGRVPAGTSVSKVLRERAAKIMEQAGYIPAAKVVVDVKPPRALIVFGDGIEPDKGTPNVFTVAPGRYPVKATLDGFYPAETTVDAKSGEQTRANLELQEEESLVSSPWFWAGVVAVVAGGSVAVAQATKTTERCLCVSLNGFGCQTCEQQ